MRWLRQPAALRSAALPGLGRWLLLAGFLPRVVVAQSLDPVPTSSAELSLAGAGAVLPHEPSSIFRNPALLGLAEGRLALGILLGSTSDAVHRLTADPVPEARDESTLRVLPLVALVQPFLGERLWIGLGYHLALSTASRYPPQVLDGGDGDRLAPGRYRGTELDLQHHLVSLGLAYRTRIFAVGAALELGHLRLRHRQALWAGSERDAARGRLEDPRLDLDAVLEVKGTVTVGGVIGLWLRPLSWWELGLSLHLPTTAGLSGMVTLTPGERPPEGFTAITARDGTAALDFRLPLTLQGGMVLGPARLRLVLEAGYARWSDGGDLRVQLDGAALMLEGASPAELPLAELPLGLALRDRFSLHAGVEAHPWPGYLVVRAGYGYRRGATRPAAPSSVLLDLDHHVLGLGVQVRRGLLRLGVALAHTFESTLDASGDEARLINPVDPTATGPVGQGRYTTSALQVLLDTQISW